MKTLLLKITKRLVKHSSSYWYIARTWWRWTEHLKGRWRSLVVLLKLALEKRGPFGFNKNGGWLMDSFSWAWNTKDFVWGFLFTGWIVGLYVGKLKIDHGFAWSYRLSCPTKTTIEGLQNEGLKIAEKKSSWHFRIRDFLISSDSDWFCLFSVFRSRLNLVYIS